jgi:hypothetical protein
MRAKPTLLFFQYKYDERLPAFLLAHKEEHVKCLSQFFNVVVIDHDCDYEEICDIHQPELTLFESGVPFPSCRRPKITNARAYSHVPKLGFLHSDAFCCGRAGFLSDMEHLGISTYFAIATAAAENTPAISDSLFVWPNFVDPEVHCDYGLWKSIPVLFTGNSTALYPWRQRMARLIPKHYPSLICNHPGYAPQKAQQQIRVGESYARMLNASWFVPSCGTLAKEIVRKHFEIPACRSCLVAEPSPALEAAGFVDMVNCVLADEHDVLDKLAFLFSNQDALEKVIQTGFELVQRSHTIKQRDQIFQWYELNKAAQPNQKIVQSGPFEPLRLVDGSPGRISSSLKPNGLHLQLLQEGDRLLWSRDYQGAERLYLKCAQYIPWMPEPKFRLALCNLYKGNAKAALTWISEPIQFTLSEYRAADPDPVEWAYFIIATICSGSLAKAIQRANQYPWLRHPELDRTRLASMILAGRPVRKHEPFLQYRRSIHQLPDRSDDEWIATLRDLLAACDQGALAEKLQNYLSRRDNTSADASNCDFDTKSQEAKSFWTPPPVDVPTVAAQPTVRYFKWRLRSSKLRTSLKMAIKRTLYGLESKFGYFLPYHLSSCRNDEFYKIVQDLARGEKIGATLVLGTDWRGRSTQALVAGLREREEQSPVLCLRTNGRNSGAFKGRTLKQDFVKCYGPLSPTSCGTPDELLKAIMQMKDDNDIIYFDTILIDGRVLDESIYMALREFLRKAKYVLLADVNHVHVHEIYRRLRGEEQHRITSENPDLRNGYAVFERYSDDSAGRVFRRSDEQPAAAGGCELSSTTLAGSNFMWTHS